MTCSSRYGSVRARASITSIVEDLVAECGPVAEGDLKSTDDNEGHLSGSLEVSLMYQFVILLYGLLVRDVNGTVQRT